MHGLSAMPKFHSPLHRAFCFNYSAHWHRRHRQHHHHQYYRLRRCCAAFTTIVSPLRVCIHNSRNTDAHADKSRLYCIRAQLKQQPKKRTGGKFAKSCPKTKFSKSFKWCNTATVWLVWWIRFLMKQRSTVGPSVCREEGGGAAYMVTAGFEWHPPIPRCRFVFKPGALQKFVVPFFVLLFPPFFPPVAHSIWIFVN